VTGRLDATFAIDTPLDAGLPALLERARGSIDIAIRDGRMPGIGAVRQAVLRFANRAEPAPRVEATDAFGALEASFALQSGIARITRLAMKAPDFDMTGTGVLSPVRWTVSIGADVTLTEELSRQAGRDLYRYARDGRRIVLPVRIGGTLFEPTAFIDVARAAGRALRNRTEEELKSLLDRVLKKPEQR
jgi:hypothetical protein